MPERKKEKRKSSAQMVGAHRLRSKPISQRGTTSPWKERGAAAPVCYGKRHKRTVWSWLPDTAYRPSGEKATWTAAMHRRFLSQERSAAKTPRRGKRCLLSRGGSSTPFGGPPRG